MRLNYERRGVHSAVPGHTLKADKAVHSTARSHDSVSCALGPRPRSARHQHAASTAPPARPARGGPRGRRPRRLVRPPRGHAAPTAHRPDAEGLERSGRGRTGGRAGSWSGAPAAVGRTRRYRYPVPAAFRIENSTSETSHVWTSVPRPPKKNPNVRRLYDVPTRDAACRTRDGFIADSMDIRYRALWISRVDGASSMPDGAHWLAQSRSPQTPSRRAGCGSLMWAALSMSICVIIRGGVLRLAEAAAAAVA